jgi:hypothetical protein
MNTRLLMSASAAALLVVGLAAEFLPEEILLRSGVAAPGQIGPLLVQLLGAFALSAAMLNWMGRENLIGGIYSRPVAVTNAVQFTTGALALAKGIQAGARDPILIALCAVWAVFAAAFLLVLFRHPAPPKD